jgi:hydroxylamine reductase
MSSMFCYQCEQTANGTGCTRAGVCGKAPETASLQDALIYVTKGIGAMMHRAAAKGVKDRAIDHFVIEALFTTVTNVNFDDNRLAEMLRKAYTVRDKARALLAKTDAAAVPAATATNEFGWRVDGTPEQIAAAAAAFSIEKRRAAIGEDLVGLQELATYGLKGMAAYADHARVLGQEDDAIYAFFHEALDALTQPPAVDALVGLALKCGEVNLKIMALLDTANTGAYGHPVPTAVRVTPVKGKCILVSGHDLKDLDLLLQQTAGKGINIYTHGEMLPCHGYPGLKKYPHLVGNYGGAWQDQQKEFDAFPGAILMTTNCIQRPRPSYMGRIFTSGLVAWPGVQHIADGNFAPVIAAAQAASGFAADEPAKTILVGFGHNAVLGVAPTVIEAVKAGKLRHFFLIGGCDGAKSGRNYYTDFAEQVPKDCAILTLACGKYRFNKLEFGDIGGIPRLLDCGQCNDAYSAIKIAVALADAFGTDVNGLPLSLVLSWYEQKAVCILLTLLHLGLKNIRLGPTLPAFVTPTVLKVLVDNFNIMPTTTAEADLKAILG